MGREIEFKYVFKKENDIKTVIITIHDMERNYWDKTIVLENIGYELIDRLQYTGLKDKNGNEIYEGDVITLGNISIRNIKYDRGSFTMFDGESRRSPLSDYVVNHTIEVIGNIYEHPHLLEAK